MAKSNSLACESSLAIPTYPRTPLTGFFDRFPNPGSEVEPWLLGYFVLITLETAALLVSDFFLLIITYGAGKRMFRDIMYNISNATFRFYDVTPLGRLLNRVTGDVGTVDGNISGQFLRVAFQAMIWTSSIFGLPASHQHSGLFFGTDGPYISGSFSASSQHPKLLGDSKWYR